MDVLPSAFRHGIANEDVQHALRNALVVEQVADDPDRFLVLAPIYRHESLNSLCWTDQLAPQ